MMTWCLAGKNPSWSMKNKPAEAVESPALMALPEGIGIKRLHHIGIVVRDLVEAIGRYQTQLGLSLSHRGDLPSSRGRDCLFSVGRKLLGTHRASGSELRDCPFFKQAGGRGASYCLCCGKY